MSNKSKNGLFIFRRDLRIVDNNGLNFLSELCENIYTIFIFTPEQVGSQNKYKSDNSVQFMIESLEDLSSEIKSKGGKLNTFYGHNDKVIADCIKAFGINIVAFNLDITPYARDRDDKIVKMCQKMKIYVTYDHDYYLCNPGSVLNGSGEVYQKFTPYYNQARTKKVEKPVTKKIHFKSSEAHIPNKITLDLAMKKFVGKENNDILVHGGRTEALKQMKIASKNIKHYAQSRDELSKPTSQLSAYIKFGNVSIREVFYDFKSNHAFIRQLYWREFYAGILYEFPHVLGHALKPKYDKIKWHHNERWFHAWTNGMTGFPIVDAGMRELNTTGYMVNRARLITMSFLIKTMLIDYRLGERYFATKLTDYDPASNNGNTLWVMGGGADSQQYMRIFNPFTQAKEHDSDCKYIKTWIQELRNVDNEIILNWETEWQNHQEINYPKPIVNYKEQREKALKMYSDALYYTF
jgi:deoxyribodipyrimidine photo-lyase